MESKKVKELMVPISRYATVSEDASLYEAVLAFEEARQTVDREIDKHRAILVLDKNLNIVGKIDLWDLLKGTEPKYKRLGYPREITGHDCSEKFGGAVVHTYGLWREAFRNLCLNASRVSAKEIMHVPGREEHIEEDALLGEAINRMLGGELQSLLVDGQGGITGILRLSDVVKEIASRIKACQIDLEGSCETGRR